MVLLVLFAMVAGAGTALTPCVLPVLPALLAASGSGGRRRPLGVILGLVATFTVTIVALASVIDGVGLPDGRGADGRRRRAARVRRSSLLVPSLAARVEAPLTRLARFGPRDRGDGFWSGLVVGAGLGFVYAPCAGPILAAVVVGVGDDRGHGRAGGRRRSATRRARRLVLLVLALGGRRLLDRCARPGADRPCSACSAW